MTQTHSFLEQIDRADVTKRLALVRQLMADHPLEFFRELRTHRPVLVLPECALVALYDDVIEMLNMPKVFTVALYVPKMANGYLMMHDDDALHYREKSIMQGFLNRDDLPKVRKMVGCILRGLAGQRFRGASMRWWLLPPGSRDHRPAISSASSAWKTKDLMEVVVLGARWTLSTINPLISRPRRSESGLPTVTMCQRKEAWEIHRRGAHPQ